MCSLAQALPSSQLTHAHTRSQHTHARTHSKGAPSLPHNALTRALTHARMHARTHAHTHSLPVDCGGAYRSEGGCRIHSLTRCGLHLRITRWTRICTRVLVSHARWPLAHSHCLTVSGTRVLALCLTSVCQVARSRQASHVGLPENTVFVPVMLRRLTTDFFFILNEVLQHDGMEILGSGMPVLVVP